jgi:hypothetical protein
LFFFQHAADLGHQFQQPFRVLLDRSLLAQLLLFALSFDLRAKIPPASFACVDRRNRRSPVHSGCGPALHNLNSSCFAIFFTSSTGTCSKCVLAFGIKFCSFAAPTLPVRNSYGSYLLQIVSFFRPCKLLIQRFFWKS